MDEHRIDVVVLDVRMPGIGGLEVLRKTKQKHPLVEVIMLSGHATVESAVDGLKLGAFDYVTKPCDISDISGKDQRGVRSKGGRGREDPQGEDGQNHQTPHGGIRRGPRCNSSLTASMKRQP